MTTCACCSPASASLAVPTMTSRWRCRPCRRWSTTCWHCPRTAGSWCCPRSSPTARESRPTCSKTCARKASYGCGWMARCTISTPCRGSTASASTASRWWSIGSRCVTRPDNASPNLSRPHCGCPMAAPWRSRWTPAASTCSARTSPARCAATHSPNSNRACSRSTTRSAPVRAATGSVSSPSSMPSGWWPSRNSRWPPGRSRAGTDATSSIS